MVEYYVLHASLVCEACINFGSISTALSCLVHPPREERERSAGSFPEKRLVIEPRSIQFTFEGMFVYYIQPLTFQHFLTIVL